MSSTDTEHTSQLPSMVGLVNIAIGTILLVVNIIAVCVYWAMAIIGD